MYISMADKPISSILTAYFVNQYLNTLRNRAAVYHKDGKYHTLEDAYKNVMYDLTRAFCGQGELYGVIYYNKIIEDFYKNTYLVHINKEDKFLGFIDRLTLEILPKDYYDVLGSNYKKKEEIVREILRGCLNEFAKYITTEKLRDVLGNKDKKKIVSETKEKFNSLMDLKINTFINSVNLPKSDKHDLINNSAELNRKLLAHEKTIRDLKDKLKKKSEEKKMIIRDRNELARRLNQQKTIIKEKNNLIAKLQTRRPDTSYNLEEVSAIDSQFVPPADEQPVVEKLVSQQQVEQRQRAERTSRLVAQHSPAPDDSITISGDSPPPSDDDDCEDMVPDD